MKIVLFLLGSISLAACNHSPVMRDTAAEPSLFGVTFRHFDLGHHGQIAHDDFEAVLEEEYSALDPRGSGTVDLSPGVSELTSREQGELKALHKRPDGKISIVEFLREGDRVFERADLNKDGVLSREEFDRAAAAERAP